MKFVLGNMPHNICITHRPYTYSSRCIAQPFIWALLKYRFQKRPNSISRLTRPTRQNCMRYYYLKRKLWHPMVSLIKTYIRIWIVVLKGAGTTTIKKSCILTCIRVRIILSSEGGCQDLILILYLIQNY